MSHEKRRVSFDESGNMIRIPFTNVIEAPVEAPIPEPRPIEYPLSSVSQQNVISDFMNGGGSADFNEEQELDAITSHELSRKQRLYISAGKVALALLAVGATTGTGVYASTSLHLGRVPNPVEFTRGVADYTANVLTDDTKYEIRGSHD